MVDHCYVCDADHKVRDCPNKGKGKGKGKANGKGDDRGNAKAGQAIWKHLYKCKCGWTVAPSEATPNMLTDRCGRLRNSWSAKMGQKGCGLLRGAGMDGWCDASGTVMSKADIQDLEEKFNLAQGKKVKKKK